MTKKRKPLKSVDLITGESTLALTDYYFHTQNQMQSERSRSQNIRKRHHREME